jgi:hypothetical protein
VWCLCWLCFTPYTIKTSYWIQLENISPCILLHIRYSENRSKQKLRATAYWNVLNCQIYFVQCAVKGYSFWVSYKAENTLDRYERKLSSSDMFKSKHVLLFQKKNMERTETERKKGRGRMTSSLCIDFTLFVQTVHKKILNLTLITFSFSFLLSLSV